MARDSSSLPSSVIWSPISALVLSRPRPIRRLFQMRLPDVALRLGLLGMDAGDDELSALRAALLSVEPAVLTGRLGEIVSVDVSNEFAQGTVPLLYIAGGRDRLVGTRVMAQMKRVRPDMQAQVLDAPHLVLQRRPVEAAQLILGVPRLEACLKQRRPPWTVGLSLSRMLKTPRDGSIGILRSG